MIEQLRNVIGEIEHEWATKRLLVVGDVMLDKYIWGEVSRISPEAPVPVVRASHQSEQPGGAANVAMNLTRLGAQTILAGFTRRRRERETACRNSAFKWNLASFRCQRRFPHHH